MKSENAKPLTDDELSKLTEALSSLEWRTMRETGYHRLSGGFATAKYFDYNDDVIDIELTFGCQSDVDDVVYTEQYEMSRNTFKIID